MGSVARGGARRSTHLGKAGDLRPEASPHSSVSRGEDKGLNGTTVGLKNWLKL